MQSVDRVAPTCVRFKATGSRAVLVPPFVSFGAAAQVPAPRRLFSSLQASSPPLTPLLLFARPLRDSRRGNTFCPLSPCSPLSRASLPPRREQALRLQL